MKVIIRADASIYIGSGHVMRCLVLAQSLRNKGHQVTFASRPQQGDLLNFIRNKGFPVYELTQPENWLEPTGSSDYQAWLQVPWQQDAKNLIECADDADLLVVDHYGINLQWEKKIKKHYKCRLFVIDDLVRAHDADLLLDQTLMRDAREYQSSYTANNILTGCEELIVLHCVSGYPTPAEQYNLRTITDLSQQFDVLSGLSDHTIDNATAVAAVALGACLIEKHVTLDRNGGGADDSFSLEPKELTQLCKDCKTAWQALGKVNYGQTEAEKVNVKFRRSLYVVKDIKAGEKITAENVRSIRPGFGLLPKFYNAALGQKAKVNITKGSPLSFALIEQ